MKFYARLVKKNSDDKETFRLAYENFVEGKIRERYTVGRELAILRQRDTKPDEFAEYNAYVEGCKAEVRAELGMEVAT